MLVSRRPGGAARRLEDEPKRSSSRLSRAYFSTDFFDESHGAMPEAAVRDWPPAPAGVGPNQGERVKALAPRVNEAAPGQDRTSSASSYCSTSEFDTRRLMIASVFCADVYCASRGGSLKCTPVGLRVKVRRARRTSSLGFEQAQRSSACACSSSLTHHSR